MARSRLDASTGLSSLFFLLLLAAAFFSTSASATSPGDDSASEKICHSSDPSECYPKVFVPTDEFQIVKPDQDLPPGLHVRMNIWTGEKEAKINVPDEVDSALEGMPVDHAVLVVDPQEDDKPQIPKGAPAYEPVGKVKGPEHESQTFLDAMSMLKSGVIESDTAFDTSLEALEDISHDMYYGLKTTENTEVLKALFCLMEQQGIPSVNGATPRDQQAASIISAALQNNPAALKEVATQWEDIMATKCPATEMAVKDLFYSSFMPFPAGTSNITDAAAAPKVKAKVSAIKGLMKDQHIRRQFLENGGMERLLEVLTSSVPDTKDWTAAQRRVGQLVLDTFLDEDMGANLGEWPTVPSSKNCGPHEATAGCWEEHVSQIMKKNKSNKDHWSKQLHQALTAALKESKHQEL